MVTNQKTTEDDNNDFSNENQTTDYTSIEGVRTRTGIDNDQLFGNFIVKELIDNALDFIEQNAKTFEKIYYSSKQNPYVNVIIAEEIEGKVTKIKVRNSSAVDINNNVFSSKEQVENIFKLDRYYSSKRHQHIIKRGALGDGLKEILCIPYAFAIDNNNNDDDADGWNYPLKINISNDRVFEVRINNISEVRRNIKPAEINVIETIATAENHNNDDDNNNFTEITVYIPKIFAKYNVIYHLLQKYILVNTHIQFGIQFPNEKQLSQYKATHNIKNWSNNQSIYYYSLPELERLVYSLENKSNSFISAYLQRHFREGTNIKKEELLYILNSTTTNTITDNNNNISNKNIEGIYKRLKQINPIRKQSDNKPALQLPCDMKLREKALQERFKQLFGIDGSIKYKKIIGYYYPSIAAEDSNNSNIIEFPFMLEIIVANIPYINKELHLFSTINFSPSLRYNPFSNQLHEKIFTWKNKNNNQPKSDDSITDIFEDCGYSQDPKKHKKTGNVILVNLISPRIGYRSHSKSQIELKPFVSIAQDIYNFCKSASIRDKNGIRKGLTVINELRILLRERECEIRKNPILREKGRWTQSTVFYTLRPRLNQKGMKVDRDYITSKIKPVCEELGYTRDELGIIAAERTQLYFKGQTLGVGFDQLKDLIEKGTDLLVIEKEGVADVLAPFADKVGIAILNSRGFLTEYATELSRLAEEKGCNIAILTDLDSSGLIISTNLPNAHRIGIDFDTLSSLELLYDDFNLDLVDVEEDVILKKGSESDNHLKSLKKFDYNIPSPYNASLFDINDDWQQLIDYLDTGKRIEIDAVLAKVGSERFWNFILNELDEKFPRRNYNRSIDVPEYVLPKEVNEFITNIQNKISELQSDKRQKIMDEFENTKGFLDVNRKKAEIETTLRSIAEEKINKVTQFISDEFKKFSNLK